MTGKKVLLVDDSATTLMLEQMVLRGEAYTIFTARSGLEAVERAAAERPDLILLDAVMPEMSGLEVLRRIRQDTATKETPIIMVTTPGEHAAADPALGCRDTITKPIDGVELLTKVRACLGA